MDCVRCYAPLVYVCGLPSAATLKCTGCGMMYYSESWAEDAPNDEEIEADLKAYTQRIKARRYAAIERALAAYKRTPPPPCTTPLYREGVQCKISGS